MAHNFDRLVACNHVPWAQAVYSYEYTAFASFERARKEGIATILDVPSLNSRAFEKLQQAEKDRFPELRTCFDQYFIRKFEKRQARRDAETRLADVLVANSNLTKQSHIAGGVDAAKIVVVPPGAPATISRITMKFDAGRPLCAVWAGNFSIGKGAHYFLDAWRRLRPVHSARASVFGMVSLPERALRPVPEGVEFCGSVSQSELFTVLEAADVLIFPTLSDGFGMVVTEAFARGVPVIATDQAGAAQLIRNRENGFIVPAGDAIALSDAVEWCLDNRATLYEMRFAALKTARQWQWKDYRQALTDAIADRLDPTDDSFSLSGIPKTIAET
jgi:glycosyltransferase involved in cell wall biosynthesis